MHRRAHQRCNKENEARNKKKSISGSSNEKRSLAVCKFRSLFRQFCATILLFCVYFAFFFLRCARFYIFALFVIILLFFFGSFCFRGNNAQLLCFFLRFVEVVPKGKVWR